MASLRKSERDLFPAGATDVLPLTRHSYRTSLTSLWSTRARVTYRDQTVQRGIRTSTVLKPLVYESVALTTRPHALNFKTTSRSLRVCLTGNSKPTKFQNGTLCTHRNRFFKTVDFVHTEQDSSKRHVSDSS